MAFFRIITDIGTRWTVKDDTTRDIAVFLNQHSYESPATKMKMLLINDAAINLDKIVAIERV